MSEPFIGQITMFAGNFAPRGWAFCHGQLLSIASNSALFSILGTTYGGDGRTTFGLPDLRGRFPTAQGNGPGLSPYNLGQKGGTEDVVLTAAQMPSHTHVIDAKAKSNNSPGDANTAAGNSWSNDAGFYSATYSTQAPTTDMHPNSIEATAANTGGGQAQTNIPPYLAINFIIALVGIFPSRN
ncbi:phage tail protein [Thalassotalea euphylliae]|uniref:phage tail protein n=1 Tax=Thalassotalea euphylliae TaxID=1655234 RepID=UPI00362F37CA